MKRSLLACICFALVFILTVKAEPPPEFDYQGKILVGDLPLTGPGYFKYAISSQDGLTNFWAHDGTAAGEPGTFITNDCYNGVFSTILGATPMVDIDPEIFAPETSMFLRVWFSEDKITFNEMLPAQDLLSVPYAMNAHMVDGLHALDIIARATNAVTLSGDISGTPGDGTTVDSLQGGVLDIGALSAGEILTWNGSVWTNAPASGGGGMDPAIASNSFVIKTGDTMTGILGINVGADNDLVITNSGDTIRIGRQTSATNAGIAIGPQSYANNRAVAIGGRFAFADDRGVAVGYEANAFDHGVAVGYQSKGYVSGTGVGALSEGDNFGAAVGYAANGSAYGVAVGYFAIGDDSGVGIGGSSSGSSTGVAVGVNANGAFAGAAVGVNASAHSHGAALGRWAYGYDFGLAAGYWADGYQGGVGLGAFANGARTNIAIGYAASAQSGTERVAIGHNVTNDMDNTARVRGNLYMDGGMSLWGRAPFGSGVWQRLVPLPDMGNVVWVATNGTPGGPGTIDRPFDIPQNGYNAAAMKYTNEPATLVIAAGRYPGLNMNKGNIHILGFDRPQLDSLTVNTASAFILGKQRVESVIVNGAAVVAVDAGSDVKFNNCRFHGGLQILGPRVEVMNCFARGSDGVAVSVGNGVSPIEEISIYNSSMFNKDSANPTLLVSDMVYYFEVIGCEIVNYGPEIGPGVFAPPSAAIIDLQSLPLSPPVGPAGQVPHLYAHNVIHGAEHGTWVGVTLPTVFDPAAVLGHTICFVNNTVWGDVGMGSNVQFHANNVVYGDINNTGGGMTWGWGQAGAGAGLDPYGNVEHQGIYPGWGGTQRGFPATWQD